MATKSIVGEKVGMTQVWTDDGRVVPVTVVRVQPARVVQVKTTERDGYSAVQVTYGTKDARKLSKPKAGHFAKAGVEAGVRLVELRLEDVSSFEVGAIVGADTFEAGERVDVTAVSKGKGFAGGMKRHGFHGVGASHGAHRNHRKPGSIGACATPPGCSRAPAWPAAWAASGSPPRTCRSSRPTPRPASCSSGAPCPAPTAASSSSATPRRPS